jgi:hypothetical protein
MSDSNLLWNKLSTIVVIGGQVCVQQHPKGGGCVRVRAVLCWGVSTAGLEGGDLKRGFPH